MSDERLVLLLIGTAAAMDNKQMEDNLCACHRR